MAASKYRKERIADAIKRLIALQLQFDFQNPDVPAFTSVTEVELSRDLSYATLYFSIPGTAEDQDRAMAALEHSKGYFRTKIAQNLNLMHAPALVIKQDKSLDYAQRIEEKLRELFASSELKQDQNLQEEDQVEHEE